MAKDRLHRLQALLSEQQRAAQDAMVGQTVDVLFEKDGRNQGQLVGKSSHLHAVYVDNPGLAIGDIAHVEILESSPNSLRGRVIAAV